MKSSYFFPIAFFLFLVFTVTGSSQSGNSPGLFESNELLHVKLTAQIGVLINDIEENAGEHPAMLSYIDEDGKEMSFPITVKTRGNFRKNPDNCDFPPLKLFFSEENVANTVFEGQDEIKLVSHCRSNQSDYEQFLFKEYLVYRLYNEFTPYSFRVRLIEISYIEENIPDDQLNTYAFLIERPKYMAGRNGGKVLNVENFSALDVDQDIYGVLAIYQYMVANNDWAVPILHNIELVTVSPLDPPFPVPYDFDWAGIVEAPYRTTIRDSLESGNADRIFKGICGSRAEFIELFDLFQEKKEDLFRLYEEFDLMDMEVKGRVIKIICEFYDIIDRKGNAIQLLKRDCNIWQ